MTDGKVQLLEMVFPAHANHYGTLFAGNALLFMSKAAYLAGRQAARTDIVMASCGDAQFVKPVPVGHSLLLEAWVSRLGRTSMTVNVTGWAEDTAGEGFLALKGEFKMVAVDAQGQPQAIRSALPSKETK